MDVLLKDQENCLHSQLKQADHKTTKTKARVSVLNKRIVLFKDKIPATLIPELPQVLPKFRSESRNQGPCKSPPPP